MTFRTVQQQVLESTRPKVYECWDTYESDGTSGTVRLQCSSPQDAAAKAAEMIDEKWCEFPKERTITVKNRETGEERTYHVESETMRTYTARQA